MPTAHQIKLKQRGRREFASSCHSERPYRVPDDGGVHLVVISLNSSKLNQTDLIYHRKEMFNEHLK